MNNYWKNKALKRKGIKGEHAYLEAVEDFEKLLIRERNKYNKLLALEKADSLEILREKYFKRK